MSFGQVQILKMIAEVSLELTVTYHTCHNSLLEPVVSVISVVWLIAVCSTPTSGGLLDPPGLCPEALQTTQLTLLALPFRCHFRRYLPRKPLLVQGINSHSEVQRDYNLPK